jgi:uncharacterized membrane protein YhhN
MKRLLAASAICSAIFLLYVIAPQFPGARFAVVFKVASIALLALIAAVVSDRSKLLIAALGFSAIGDFFLGVHGLGPLGPEQLFLMGLVSFLVAHLFYVALFLTHRAPAARNTARKLACAAVAITAAASLFVLWAGLGPMRVPVLAYSLVLTAMAVTAQLSRFSNVVRFGALSFVASDTMLALSIFGHPFTRSHILVWITYYAAQALITTGVALGASAYTARVSSAHRS